MRRLAALTIAVGLAAIIVARVGTPAGSSAALALGVALIAASIVGWLCEFVRLPRVTGYLAFGLLCGPSLANIITDPMARDLRTGSSFAIVVIAVIAGLRLNLRRRGPTLASTVLFAGTISVIVWVGIAASLSIVSVWIPLTRGLPFDERAVAAALTATLLVAASPAVTVAIIAESRARGPLADRSMEIAVLMQVVSLVLLAGWQAIAAFVFEGSAFHAADALVGVAWTILGSVAFGTAMGALLTLYLRYVGRELTIVLLALCAILTAFTAPFGLEPFLAGLAAGLVVQNVLPEVGTVLHDAMEHAAMPVLVLFFAALGASMHVEAVATIGTFAVGLTALFAGFLRVGVSVGARVTGDTTPVVRSLLWRALLPTAGTTVGWAAVAIALPDWGSRLQAAVVAVVAITQLVGPIIFRAALVQAGEIGRSDGTLIVVSNREPWVHERAEDGSIQAKPTPGGVSVALDALMRERGGVWIAHGAGSADRDVVDENQSVEVPPDAPAYRLRRLWLTPYQEEHYYAGFSNSALWPLCHQAHVRPVFNDEDWTAYQEVNRLFAEAAAAEAKPNSSVFLNDYHLALVAKELRARRQLRTALFWHIPWPDVDRLRICPWRRELLEGMLSNDLVAFQVPRDQRNFLAAVADEIGASVSGDVVYFGDRPVRVVSIPIGADFDRISTILAEPTLPAEMQTLADSLGLSDHIVGVGVDRLDYTKGIPERVAAIARVLRERPQLVGRFTFLQIGVPSRSDVPGYAEIQEEIEGQIARVNQEFGRRGRACPIIYLKETFQLPQLVALYRIADFCVVSSLHDGMNLVAKEFVAARDDHQGVLILSELAGAAEELSEALIINPYDERGFAAAIERAIEMPRWEQRRRMQALRRRVAGRDVLAWASDILDRLERRKGTGFLSG
ncbi:MAG TPA: trehalose-6-phosphate synthase [Vicinamibacterales bacterium]|nr:trehalose-6-phosphate synthase [Vicinamibacterales bacterium]